MKLFSNFFIPLFLVFLASSCAKKIIEVVASEPIIEYKIKDKVLRDALDSLSLLKVKTFYTKLKVDYKAGKQDLSFKASVKIVTDSAMNVIFSYANIPIINALITNDSIKIIDRQAKCYTKERLNYFSELFGIDFSYQNIENLIMGRPMTKEFNEAFYVGKAEYDSIFRDTTAKNNLILNYSLSSETKKLVMTKIFKPSDSIEIQIRYVSTQVISDFTLPNEINISISSPRNKIFIRLEYDKPEVDKKLELIFIIPEKYEICN